MPQAAHSTTQSSQHTHPRGRGGSQEDKGIGHPRKKEGWVYTKMDPQRTQVATREHTYTYATISGSAARRATRPHRPSRLPTTSGWHGMKKEEKERLHQQSPQADRRSWASRSSTKKMASAAVVHTASVRQTLCVLRSSQPPRCAPGCTTHRGVPPLTPGPGRCPVGCGTPHGCT